MAIEQRELRAVPAVLQARYRVGRVLGSGGRSTVYAAQDSLLNREVAIKVFTARASDPEDLRVQQAEAQLVASLNHYALTTLFDAGVDASDPDAPQIYLVMEYIPGADLRHRLQSGPLSAAQVCWLGFDLCEGLEYVHEAGFLHHDIKPANILLADRRASTRMRGKLTDFGISSLIGVPEDGEYTTGTAAYLGPEQVEGLDATPETDVYALGLVLLEALSGEVAYPGTIEQSALARLDRQPRIPDDAPAGLADVLRRMTARRPEDRIGLPAAIEAFRTLVISGLGAEARVGAPAPIGDERLRLAALREYDILDTPSDEAFDAVTRLAAQMLNVPISIVTILDADRVWFKSRQGLDLSEVDRNTAFCSVTNPDGRQPWSVPDALADPRLINNSLVIGEPFVRSYAAAPLVTRDGHQLGALCVFDREPRAFDEQELRNLADLASIVMREMELRLASRRAIFNSDRR